MLLYTPCTWLVKLLLMVEPQRLMVGPVPQCSYATELDKPGTDAEDTELHLESLKTSSIFMYLFPVLRIQC